MVAFEQLEQAIKAETLFVWSHSLPPKMAALEVAAAVTRQLMLSASGERALRECEWDVFISYVRRLMRLTVSGMLFGHAFRSPRATLCHAGGALRDAWPNAPPLAPPSGTTPATPTLSSTASLPR